MDGGEGHFRTCILVHNVSHLDLFLSVRSVLRRQEAMGVPPPFVRPQFNAFARVSELCLRHVATLGAERVYGSTPSLKPGTQLVLHPTDTGTRTYPVGIALDPALPIGPEADFHVRDARHVRGGGSEAGSLDGTGVYFPLIAVVLPRWRQLARQVSSPASSAVLSPTAADGEGGGAVASPAREKERRIRLVLILVSGEMSPRDPTHSAEENSTADTARLLGAFAKALHPDLVVRHIHSSQGVLRFDDSVQFVREHLLPLVHAERRGLVVAHGEEWARYMHVTMAFTSGAPARISAISAGLRPYRPGFLHVFELKHMWHSGTLSFRDVDTHDFDSVDTAPSLAAQELPPVYMLAAHAMREYHDSFTSVRDGWYDGDTSCANDLAAFWLRKSRKPVLAIFVVRRPLPHAALAPPYSASDAAEEGGAEEKGGADSSSSSSSSSSATPAHSATSSSSSSSASAAPSGGPSSRKRPRPGEGGSGEAEDEDAHGGTGARQSVLWRREWGEGTWVHVPEHRGWMWQRTDDDASSQSAAHTSYIYRCYRGVNLEVSLPTGSLCAERAAIASALADEPSILRRDCVAVAVLSASLLPRQSWSHMLPTDEDAGLGFTSPPSLSHPHLASSRVPQSEAVLRARRTVSSELALWGQQPTAPSSTPSALPPSTDPPSTDPPSSSSSASSAAATNPSPRLSALVGGPAGPAASLLDLTTEADDEHASTKRRQQASHLQASPQSLVRRASLSSPSADDRLHLSAPAHKLPRRDSTASSGSAGGGGGVVGGGAISSTTQHLGNGGKSDGTNSTNGTDGAEGVFGAERSASSARNVEADDDPLSLLLRPLPPLHPPPLPAVSLANVREQGLGRGLLGSDVCLNPLPPCGACTEWLRRLAAAQPEFSVLTFTDTSCQRAFLRSVG